MNLLQYRDMFWIGFYMEKITRMYPSLYIAARHQWTGIPSDKVPETIELRIEPKSLFVKYPFIRFKWEWFAGSIPYTFRKLQPKTVTYNTQSGHKPKFQVEFFDEGDPVDVIILQNGMRKRYHDYTSVYYKTIKFDRSMNIVDFSTTQPYPETCPYPCDNTVIFCQENIDGMDRQALIWFIEMEEE